MKTNPVVCKCAVPKHHSNLDNVSELNHIPQDQNRETLILALKNLAIVNGNKIQPSFFIPSEENNFDTQNICNILHIDFWASPSFLCHFSLNVNDFSYI